MQLCVCVFVVFIVFCSPTQNSVVFIISNGFSEFSQICQKNCCFFHPLRIMSTRQSKQIIIIMNDESICLKIWKNINFINFKRHSFYELNLKGGKFAFWGQKALMFFIISKLLHLRDICEYFSIFFSCDAKL